ncbi:MAG: hypothetical protein MJ246_08110 [Clostridia bacterium]|nr:hypothetical protein [Clostridia bacterium]
MLAILVNLVAFIAIFLLIMTFVRNDITKRVLDTTNALKGTSEQVAIKAEQFSRAGNYISMDSKRQIETIKEVTDKVEAFGAEYEKNYGAIDKATKLADNLTKVVEKGDVDASEMISRLKSIKDYVDESDDVTRRLRELRDNALSEELKYNIDKIIDIVDTLEVKLNDGYAVSSTVANTLKSLLLEVNSMKVGVYDVKGSADTEIAMIKQIETALIRLQDSTNEQKEKGEENIETGSSLKSELENVANVIDDLKKI